MPSKWQTVRIFISSTFRDMHSERDYLVKVVFPRLRERLEKYRVHLIDIDLRPLSRLTVVGTFFMSRCSSLTVIDLRPLTHVTSVGSCFMAHCTSLVSIELGRLAADHEADVAVGESFLVRTPLARAR